jgi:hypothetical protein
LLVSDPSFSKVVRSLLSSSPERVARAVVQAGLGQQLALAGLPAAAESIVSASVDAPVPSLATALQARPEERERAVRDVALEERYRFPVPVKIEGREYRSLRFEAQGPPEVQTVAREQRDGVPYLEEQSAVGRERGPTWSVESSEQSASVTTPLGFRFRLSLAA